MAALSLDGSGVPHFNDISALWGETSRVSFAEDLSQAQSLEHTASSVQPPPRSPPPRPVQQRQQQQQRNAGRGQQQVVRPPAVTTMMPFGVREADLHVDPPMQPIQPQRQQQQQQQQHHPPPPPPPHGEQQQQQQKPQKPQLQQQQQIPPSQALQTTPSPPPSPPSRGEHRVQPRQHHTGVMSLGPGTHPEHRKFLFTLQKIEDAYHELPRALKIRVERWVSKMVDSVENPVWRKERNLYAAALMQAVETRDFKPPFHSSPPDGGLPSLPGSLRSEIKAKQASRSKSFWRGVRFKARLVGEREFELEHHLALPDDSDEVRELKRVVAQQEAQIAEMKADLAARETSHTQELSRMAEVHQHELEQLRAQMGGAGLDWGGGGAGTAQVAQLQHQVEQQQHLLEQQQSQFQQQQEQQEQQQQQRQQQQQQQRQQQQQQQQHRQQRQGRPPVQPQQQAEVYPPQQPSIAHDYSVATPRSQLDGPSADSVVGPSGGPLGGGPLQRLNRGDEPDQFDGGYHDEQFDGYGGYSDGLFDDGLANDGASASNYSFSSPPRRSAKRPASSSTDSASAPPNGHGLASPPQRRPLAARHANAAEDDARGDGVRAPAAHKPIAPPPSGGSLEDYLQYLDRFSMQSKELSMRYHEQAR